MMQALLGWKRCQGKTSLKLIWDVHAFETGGAGRAGATAVYA
jgi:hypothetical protein